MSKFSHEELEKIESLVEKVQEGDTEAFGELYEIFVQPLYRYVYYRMPKDEVEDLLETVFLKVWENIGKYVRKDNNFSAWLFRVAHNLIADFYRTRKDETLELDVNLPDDERMHNPIRHTKNSINNEYIQKALSKLKEQHQQIIVLKFINELSNSEISKIMRKSEGALRILQHRALKSLKKVLTEMGIEP